MSVLLRSRTRQHIANFFLDWIRRDSTQERLASCTQREIRDELLRLVALEDEEALWGRRIANEFTRWVFSGAEDIRDMRWREDLECRQRILRVMSRAIEKEGAEEDGDISDDLLAASYPRAFERVRDAMANAEAFLRNQQSLDMPARVAEAKLVRLIRDGVEDWEASV